MNDRSKEEYLKSGLTTCGVIFFLICPLGISWPAGGQWHGGEGRYYLHMICGVYAVLGFFLIRAARDPAANKSLIDFTVWSSVVHAGIMAMQASGDPHESGHLAGAVPALLLVAIALWYLSPRKTGA